jgi:hypothetical protein
MDKFIKKYNIDKNLKNLVKINKPKVYTKFNDIILKIENMQHQMDVLYLPETDEGYKYLLNIIDLYTKKVDFEPLKSIKQIDIIKALDNIYKRKILRLPFLLMSSDNGKEFGADVSKYFYKKNIGYKRSEPYKHSQNAVIEAFNREMSKILNLYMFYKEREEGHIYKNWSDIIEDLRGILNEDKKPKKFNMDEEIKMFKTPYKNNKFNIGDLVYYKSQVPLNSFFEPQPTKNFRKGDIRYNQPKKIINIFLYPRGIIKYKLEGVNRTVYDENDLLKADEKNIKYIVEKIKGKKTIKNKVHYLIKWKGYKEETYEPKTSLIKDGFKEHIDKYEKENKK